MRGNVLWLSVVSLLNDASSEMIYPLLPAFVLQVLGAGPAFLGLIEGVAETTSSLVKLGGGWLSDRLRRRKLLAVWGYGIAALLRPFIAVATQPWHVLGIRFADRVGKGVRTAPRDALLAESVEPGVRGTAFGIHRAADHAGAVVGPLMAAGLLLLPATRLRLVFALAAIPGLLGVLVLVIRVREQGGRGTAAGGAVATEPESATTTSSGAATAGPASDGAAGAAGPGGPGALQRLGGGFLRLMAVLVLFTLGNASDAFLLLRAQQLGVGLALIPILWAAFHVSKMSWSVPGGMLADRHGPRRSIAAGWLVYAAAYAGFAVAGREWQIWALFLFYGLFYGLTEAPEKALVASLAPAGERGLAFGAYHSAIGLAALPASVMFGLLWQRFGPETAFLTGATLALLAALALALLSLPSGGEARAPNG
jgi:MFS family permease